MAKQVPLDRVLIETDSPYLAPMPYRGKSNEPKYVPYVAKALSDVYDKSIKALVCSFQERKAFITNQKPKNCLQVLSLKGEVVTLCSCLNSLGSYRVCRYALPFNHAEFNAL